MPPLIGRTGLTPRQWLASRRGEGQHGRAPMVDYFAIALTHGLIALAAWRLFLREDLDLDTDDDTVLLTELLVPEAALLTDLSPEELPLETVDAVLDTPEPEAILEIPDVLEPNEPVEFREPK